MSSSITKTDLDKQIKQGIENLYEELKQGRVEQLTDYLTSATRLRYSPNNLMLIYLQCPHASLLKTYDRWKKLGYQVRRDSKSIKILQPKPFTKTVDKNGEEEEVVIPRYRYLDLFDISQVDKVREAAVDLSAYGALQNIEPADEHYMSYYDEMKTIMQQGNISVTELPLLLNKPGVEGVSYGGRVEIKYATSQDMYIALGHEWAHEILHQGSENEAYSTNYKECQAEATAYIVCGALGVYSSMSKDYILGWGNTTEDFKANLDMVIKASNVMLEAIYKYRGVSETNNAENVA